MYVQETSSIEMYVQETSSTISNDMQDSLMVKGSHDHKWISQSSVKDEKTVDAIFSLTYMYYYGQ
jgi:hypothetical protein